MLQCKSRFAVSFVLTHIVLMNPVFKPEVVSAQTESQSYETLIADGDEALRSHLYNQALELYNSVLTAAPLLHDNSAFQLKLAMSLYHTGDFSSALEMLTELKTAGTAYNEYIAYFIGMSLLKSGRNKEAEKAFSLFQKSYRGSLLKNEASYLTGFLLHKRGEFSESNMYFRFLGF